jgi:hypothetical protein
MKEDEPEIIRFSALLPVDLHKRVRYLAVHRGVSANAIVKEALEDYLARGGFPSRQKLEDMLPRLDKVQKRRAKR